MRELSLFTGTGGGILGTKLLGWTPVGYVEWDDYCQRVLRQRQEDGHIETAPIFSDIRAFISEGYARRYRGMVDVITGGFPCQDISIANRNARGIEGERSGLWKSMFDIICTVKPRYALMENSPALTCRGLGTVLSDMAQAGYDCRWACLRASRFGAPHQRDRIWIYADAEGFNGQTLFKEDRARFRRISAQHRGISWWKTEPDLLRVDNGLAVNVDKRNKAIGNGQVPAVVRAAWELLSKQ